MTIYAGEMVRFTMKASFQREAAVPSDIDHAYISIWTKSDSTQLINEAEMVWDAETSQWIYDWETDGFDAGSYLWRGRLVGPGLHDSWEYQTVRLKQNPVPAP